MKQYRARFWYQDKFRWLTIYARDRLAAAAEARRLMPGWRFIEVREFYAKKF